ncbi:Tyrosine recombinase XerC [Actinomadura sp. RB99]|uniref:tyrosine-type recombinase/integrase n=1 Tax=Actinomadura sp. RB99 TaxID=2691577 RepID=UPI001689DD74|nr:Tyrosine recombinase XerC [Actinomadura sp. RB99]
MTEPLDGLFASFARDLRAAQKAPRTIEIYGQAVRFFSEWLASKGTPATVDALTKENLADWFAHLADEGQSENTILTRYRSMRRFVRWLIAEEEIEGNPFATLEQPKPQPKPVPVLTDKDVLALFKTCDPKTFRGRRDEAILRVLFDCGLRISELAGLTVDDVDLDQEVLRVVGKGGKVRVVPFGAKTARSLDRYLRLRRRHEHADADGLWLGQRGPYSTWGVDNMLRGRAEQAGVEGLHAHRFRHTAAHDWLVQGGQERDLMRLMGWSSDTMIGVYGASAAVERAHKAARRLKRGDRL